MKATITGNIKSIDGKSVEKALVRFTLKRTAYIQESVYLLNSTAETYSDNNGGFSISVWTNAESKYPAPYEVSIISLGETSTIDNIFVPSGKASYTIEEVLRFSSGITQGYSKEALTIQEAIDVISSIPIINFTKDGFTTFSSVAALSAKGLISGQYVYLESYHHGKARGGGLLKWDSTSTLTPDTGGIFQPGDSQTGRFIRVAHLQGSFSPEDFGAVGDNAHNDYPAFMALAAAVNRYGGGTVTLSRGASYYYDEYIDYKRTDGGPVDAWRDIPLFRGFNGLTIEGNGARIRVKGNFYRDKDYLYWQDKTGRKGWFSNIDAISNLSFAYGKNLTVSNLFLEGGAYSSTRYEVAPTGYTDYGYPIGGEITVEGYSQGLNLWGVDDVILENIHATHCQTDGFFIGHSEVWGPDGVTRVTNQTRTLCHNVTMINCTAKFNRRQGISIVGDRNLTAINCDFSYTGLNSLDANGNYVFDAYGWHEPGLGLDIEPSAPVVNPDNANYQVPEYTGSIKLINCNILHNVNGSISNIYSDKIDGNVTFDGCTIDDSKKTGPDSWLFAIIGTTFNDCNIKLPLNGFLWLETSKYRTPEFAGCTVRGGKVKVLQEFGFRNPKNNIPVTIDGVEITLPTKAVKDSMPIFFADRRDGQYNMGLSKNVKFINNTILVPYTYGLEEQFGPAIAQFEGVGQVGGNTWMLTGARPNITDPDFKWLVMYFTDAGSGQRAYVTRPYSERYVSANDTDFLAITPDGNKIAATYTYMPTTNSTKLVKSSVPFGLYGPAPQGKTALALGKFQGKGAITGIVAGFESNVSTGQSAVINIYLNLVKVATATIAPGGLKVTSTTGFPFTPYDSVENSSLLIELEYSGSGNAPEHLSGYLAVEEYV